MLVLTSPLIFPNYTNGSVVKNLDKNKCLMYL